jgi:hypothetical protein
MTYSAMAAEEEIFGIEDVSLRCARLETAILHLSPDREIASYPDFVCPTRNSRIQNAG